MELKVDKMNQKISERCFRLLRRRFFSRAEMNVKDMLKSPSAYVRARAIKSAAERDMKIENISLFLMILRRMSEKRGFFDGEIR